MKDKRKYLSCPLIFLLCICMMQINIANAAASPSLSASADVADVAAGDYVNINISLSDNPSVSTLGMALNYDRSVLNYDSTLWNGSFSKSDMQMASDTGSKVNLSVVCDSSYSTDGTVVTVRFKAVSDSSSIPVTLSLRDMADADLAAVTDCKVSSQVRVPETTGSRDDNADVKDDAEDTKTQKTGNTVNKNDTENTKENSGSLEQQAGNTASTGNGDGVQHASVQNVQPAQSSASGSAQLDQNYKTGAGLGSDIFLIIAAACGILALMLAVRKHGEEKK